MVVKLHEELYSITVPGRIPERFRTRNPGSRTGGYLRMATALVSLASPGRTLLYEHGNLLAQLPHLLLERQINQPHAHIQGCGSGSDPDSIGSVDPDSESGSGSRRAKMTHKIRKFF